MAAPVPNRDQRLPSGAVGSGFAGLSEFVGGKGGSAEAVTVGTWL